MGRGKRKHVKLRAPVTSQGHKNHSDREIIDKVHQLNQKIAAGEDVPKSARLEIEKAGGINAYQVASQRGERKAKYGNFTSAVWVTKQLKSCGLKPKDGRLRLLDVGAVTLQYEPFSSWIECEAIDLNPQHRAIIKADATQYKSSPFNVIVLSLVLNFTGDAVERGAILRNCRRLQVDGGHLFVVLPLKCLINSRLFTTERLDMIMSSLGYKSLLCHQSKKLSFHMFELAAPDRKETFSRKTLKRGPGMNKFEIILETS
ncbi:uncharacterized protein LOC135807180 [Sycon ciliatum]|uniref:uncharacterized protein LOC135807180 n=1 Tax=Sycon ciliatum TaxID=27933 RepID=UPI0020AABA78|eukprot:scpid84469/ scgid17434/ UPF0657 nucleolar protein YBR141C